MSHVFALKFSDYSDQPDNKKFYNEQLFTEVAPKYDFVTKALSLGRDYAWKKQLVNSLQIEISSPECVDLACGTGDVSRLLANRFTNGRVYGIDLTQAMLALASKQNTPNNLSFAQGDMCNLRFDNNTIDIVTGSYALRNAPDLEQVLNEVNRILKPGGLAAFLDFSKPPQRVLQFLEYWLLKSWGSFWGFALHKNHEVYSYIAESLAAFPDCKILRKDLSRHGFSIFNSQRFYFGILELLVVEKQK